MPGQRLETPRECFLAKNCGVEKSHTLSVNRTKNVSTIASGIFNPMVGE